MTASTMVRLGWPWLAMGYMLALTPEARAETMLDWAKARGAVSAQEFEDDVGRALDSPPPLFTRLRTWGTIGLGGTLARSSAGLVHEAATSTLLGLDAWMVHQSFEPLAGSWGRVWLVRSRLSGGTGSGGIAGEARIEAGIGPLWTLDRKGNGLSSRLSAEFSQEMLGVSDVRRYGVSLPMGFTSAWGELGLRPELGAIEIVGKTSGGPLLLGTYARLLGPSFLFELELTRAPGHDAALMSHVVACTRLGVLSLCTNGAWVSGRTQAERAQWGRVGVHVGLGWGHELMERTEAPTNPVHAY